MSRLTRKTNLIARTTERIRRSPTDHRIWKKMLRLCAEVTRRNGMLGQDPSTTTAVDAASRRCVRQHSSRYASL